MDVRLRNPFGYQPDEMTAPDDSIRLSGGWHRGGRGVIHGRPPCTEPDTRLACQWNEHFEIALVGRNLPDPQHPEHDSALSRRLTKLQRAVNLICQWKY